MTKAPAIMKTPIKRELVTEISILKALTRKIMITTITDSWNSNKETWFAGLYIYFCVVLLEYEVYQ